MPKRTVEGEGKKAPLNMRTTAALREKLEAAAGESGRSLVQEVEFRLEQSFATDALLGSKWSELPRLITLAIAIAPKGAHRAKALQTATRLISDAFFGGGFSAEETKMRLLAAQLMDGPAGISGGNIALAILEQVGLAQPPIWEETR